MTGGIRREEWPGPLQYAHASKTTKLTSLFHGHWLTTIYMFFQVGSIVSIVIN
jgi:hypothetical protein